MTTKKVLFKDTQNENYGEGVTTKMYSWSFKP